MVNIAVLLFYLILLWGVVWRWRHTSRRPAEYFLAGRRFGAWPVGLSVMVSCFSAVNYLAFPGEVYSYGLYVLASLPAFFLAAWPVSRFWIPFFRKQHCISIYAFLEERCDLRLRLAASTVFLLWRLLWMSTALYASCRIMEALTQIPFVILLFLGGCIAALYASLGGMKAVVWSDVLQFFVLWGSIGAALFFVCRGENFSAVLPDSGALKPFFPPDQRFFSPDPTLRITLWSALIGTTVAFLTRFGADQMVMQRYLAASDLRAAQRGLWINGIVSTLTLTALACLGVAMHLFALRRGVPAGTAPLKVMAMLLHQLPAGVPGLVAAGLLAATMSSIDSGLNSCSAAVTVDLLPHIFKTRGGLSPRTVTLILAAVVMAAAGVLLPALNRHASLFVILNKIVNVFGTPLLGVMIGALFLRKSGSIALFYGLICGLAGTCCAAVFITRLALHYYAVLSLALTLGIVALFQFGVTAVGKMGKNRREKARSKGQGLFLDRQ